MPSHSNNIIREVKRITQFPNGSVTVCKEVCTFCYMCDMGMFEKLKKHYFEHGITLRLHGNSYQKSINQKVVTAKDIIAVAKFLDTQAIYLVVF